MRSPLAPAVLPLALLLGVAGGAAGQTPTTSPAPVAAPEQTTTIQGTVPDLAGRWLVLAEVVMAQGGPGGLAIPQLWEVTAADGKPAVTVRQVKLPASILDAVNAANKDRRGWEPSVADLQALRDAWSTLAPEDRGVSMVGTIISGQGALPAEAKDDERMRDARFLIQQTLAFHPAQARPIREAMLYGVTGTQPFGYTGNYASTTLAAAPFPIPISFTGTFRMYRLESVPERGLFDRLFGAFAGCGRSAR